MRGNQSKKPAAQKTSAVLEAVKKHGLLLGKGRLYGNTIRIAPPMLISKTDLDEALARLSKAFAEER